MKVQLHQVHSCIVLFQLLRQAAKEGDVRKLDSVLKKWNREKDNINKPDKVCDVEMSVYKMLTSPHVQESKTALILAAERDHGSVIVSLLESKLGVELDYQDNKVRL